MKPTGEPRQFQLVHEADLPLMDKPVTRSQIDVASYDMNRLEVEYDYETDSEQVSHSRQMLATDLQDAIEWFIVDDPLNIVNNLDVF